MVRPAFMTLLGFFNAECFSRAHGWSQKGGAPSSGAAASCMYDLDAATPHKNSACCLLPDRSLGRLAQTRLVIALLAFALYRASSLRARSAGRALLASAC